MQPPAQEAATSGNNGAVVNHFYAEQTLLTAACNFCKGTGYGAKERCTNSNCRGGRVAEKSEKVCSKCHGNRTVDQEVAVPKTANSSPREKSTKIVKVNCPVCRGSGYEKVETQANCSTCGGSGFVQPKCPMCKGSGQAALHEHEHDGVVNQEQAQGALLADYVPCTMCSGSGENPYPNIRCDKGCRDGIFVREGKRQCNGRGCVKGQVAKQTTQSSSSGRPIANNQLTTYEPCQRCQGTGEESYQYNEKCDRCDGRGKIRGQCEVCKGKKQVWRM